MFHRREDRIAAHFQLCWLALLIMRVAEVEAGSTWGDLGNELDRLCLVTMATSEGQVSQSSEITPGSAQHLPGTEAARTGTLPRLHA